MSTSNGPVAFFIPDLGGGGAERAVVDAVRTVSASGEPVHLVLGRRDGPYAAELPAGVHVFDLGVSRMAAALVPLASYLRRAQPGVLFVALTHANVVATLAARLAGWRGRLVVSQREMLSNAWADVPAWRRPTQAALLARCYRRADLVTTVSDGVADDFRRTVPRNRRPVRTLYNATAGDTLSLRAAAPLDDAWLVPGAPPVLLAVGRLAPDKDYDTLLRAFARGAASSARLIVLGEGPLRPALESLRDSLGLGAVVRFAGFSPNPFAWMARAHALVLSSRSEGLPNVLIQALAVRCPVISTDCTSGPREILAGGEHGVLVPVGDVAALGEALHAAVKTPRVTVAADAARRFTPEETRTALFEALGLEPRA